MRVIALAGALCISASVARADRPPPEHIPVDHISPVCLTDPIACSQQPSKTCLDDPLAKGCDKPSPRHIPSAPATVPELYATVETKTSRDDLSKFLAPAAAKAGKAQAWSKAIPIYKALVVARGLASAEQKQLAQAWTAANQNDDAASAWAEYAMATSDAAEREAATSEALRLGSLHDKSSARLQLAPLTAEAKQAFAKGRAAFKKGDYGDALVLFHMGYALAPDLPGFLRELGATYDKLGATDRKRAFYRRYLVARPLGANADAIRKELVAEDKDALGTLTISSSLPCTQLWLNSQRIPDVRKLPAAGLAVAPGQYKGLCWNPTYEMALFAYASVEAGKPASMQFLWAIVVNKLEKPFGRITLENSQAPGTMMDLGISSPEVGVAVPADGHALKMVLKDDEGRRSEERQVALQPGQKLVVQW